MATDSTKCPECESSASVLYLDGGALYECGSELVDGHLFRTDACRELSLWSRLTPLETSEYSKPISSEVCRKLHMDMYRYRWGCLFVDEASGVEVSVRDGQADCDVVCIMGLKQDNWVQFEWCKTALQLSLLQSSMRRLIDTKAFQKGVRKHAPIYI